MSAALDNDILCKAACYALLNDLVESLSVAPDQVGVLGTARFVVRRKIRGASLAKGEKAALDDLAGLLARCMVLNPTDAEQLLAAEFEVAAQKLGLVLDTGESQLCAIVVERSLQLLLTGDKRAIEAIESLLATQPRLLQMSGRVRCLEQTVMKLLEIGDAAIIRNAICAEPSVDKSLTYCFGCSLPKLNLDSVIEGLQSYINAIRAPRLLA